MKRARSELRRDVTSGNWVAFSPARRKRPRDFDRPERERSQELPEHDATCPFCPGNEHLLPSIAMETPAPGLDAARETTRETRDEAPAGWMTRVVGNKHPALEGEGSAERDGDGFQVAMRGVGRHEVVIETPRHNRPPGSMNDVEFRAVVHAYAARYRELTALPEVMMAVIFRNHGERAGTSLQHPHSQIVGAGFAPREVREREEEAERYFATWGRCVYCDMIERELADGERMIMEDAHFAAFAPYAASVPFEMWLLPKRHEADFGDASEAELDAMAASLRRLLRLLLIRLDDPDYNYVIATWPAYRRGEPHLHWHVRILPRLSTRAGFEIGSGVCVNPSPPEDDAAFLRGDNNKDGNT